MNRRGVFEGALLAATGWFSSTRADAAEGGPVRAVYHLADFEKADFVLHNIRNHYEAAGGAEKVAIALVVHGPGGAGFRARGLRGDLGAFRGLAAARTLALYLRYGLARPKPGRQGLGAGLRRRGGRGRTSGRAAARRLSLFAALRRRGAAMPLESSKRPPQKPAARSQTPLWFAAGGLAVAVYSRLGHESQISDVMLWLGLALSAVALVYWFVNPKHGF